MAVNQVYLLILVNFYAPRSISGSSFPIRIWIVLGLPDPYKRGTGTDLNPTIIKQK
jgi:hypothetical protein